jgi:hypothetical protein
MRNHFPEAKLLLDQYDMMAYTIGLIVMLALIILVLSLFFFFYSDCV